jgi:hypothetical protein
MATACSDPSRLILESVTHNDAADSVTLGLDADGANYSHAVNVRTDAGIRSVVFPEQFEIFLRPYCASNPRLVKELVAITLEYIDGGKVLLPRTLV